MVPPLQLRCGEPMIEYVGILLGVCGALCNSQRDPRLRKAGFICWVPSNILMLIWAVSIGSPWVGILYIIICAQVPGVCIIPMLS